MTREVSTDDRTSHLFSKGVVGPFRRLCFGLFEGPGLSFDIGLLCGSMNAQCAAQGYGNGKGAPLPNSQTRNTIHPKNTSDTRTHFHLGQSNSECSVNPTQYSTKVENISVGERVHTV